MNKFFIKSEFFLQCAHSLVSMQNKFTLSLVLFGHKKFLSQQSLRRLGSIYGGWWCPEAALAERRKKVLVSAGLGYDTTFDALMLENGFSVIGLDPLVDCCKVAEAALSGLGQNTIINSGISTFTGTQAFYQPRNPAHDAWSTINAQESDSGIRVDFQVLSLQKIVDDYLAVERSSFNYLKMDIEGAELAIFEQSLGEFKSFDFLGVEMDFLALIPFLSLGTRLNRIKRCRRIMRRLENCGFRMVHNESFNFFWRKQS